VEANEMTRGRNQCRVLASFGFDINHSNHFHFLIISSVHMDAHDMTEIFKMN